MTISVARFQLSKPALVVITALVVVGVLPLVAYSVLGEYTIGLLITVMILTLFATSFNLLLGYTGLLSFGQAAYFGVAAYVLGILLSGRINVLPESLSSIIPASILAIVAAAVFAVVFGAFCVQLDEIYFAMLTLAFSMMLYQIAYEYDGLSGGANGITVSPPTLELGGLSVNFLSTITFYYITFGVLIISLAVLWRLVNSPYGALLAAIRENNERAEMIGVPIKRYQLSVFVVAGTFAGIAGVLFSIRNFIVTPDMLHWSMSAEPVLMTLLGGPTSFFGPAIGAFLFVFLEEALTNVTDYWQVGLGLILIPLVLFAPGGIVGLLTDGSGYSLWSRFSGRSDSERQQEQEQPTKEH